LILILYIANDTVQSIILKGKFVVPGLIDAHAHFATDPTEERGIMQKSA
jgi:imidazolonepropionase-like amidohydrolase